MRPHRTKAIAKIPIGMFEEANPRIQSSNTKFYATISQNRRKYRSTNKNLSNLRGGGTPLQYINEKFMDDSNDKTSFIYIGV